MKSKISVLILTIAILSTIIYIEINTIPNDIHIQQQPDFFNNTVPDFKFNIINKDISQSVYSLGADKIIIHFWASWCHVCTEEFKDIIRYAKQHNNVNILAISIDDDKKQLDQYIKKLHHSYNIKNLGNLFLIWDQDKSISIGLFNSNIVPETYVVNSNHEITNKFVGKADWDDSI